MHSNDIPLTEFPNINVTVLGDSSIDNKVWISPGLIANFCKSRLGIKRENSSTRISKSHQKSAKPELSVVEHLMDMLPDYKVHDYTNDGFTTSDVLKGAMRDKAFGRGMFSMFPHEFFTPLIEAQADLKKSNYIILSIGGNNFREFLVHATGIHDATKRKKYLQENYAAVFQKLTEEYIQIITQLRAINKNATIILMTQYYPSFMQNDYNIYPLMKELGEILKIGKNPEDPSDVIHEIMQQTYAAALKEIAPKNIVVADITSSLNPYDTANHSHQIEPSGIGGKKIAQMLKYIMTNKLKEGQAYRFLPDFFHLQNEDVLALNASVQQVPIAKWLPLHPSAFKDSHCHDLLFNIHHERDKYPVTSKMYKACNKIYEDGLVLLNTLENKKEIDDLKQSLSLTVDVLQGKEGAVTALKENAIHHAIGKPNHWQSFVGALSMLAGVTLIGLGIAGIPISGGASLTGLYVGGSLLSAGGAGLFYYGRQKSISNDLSQLAATIEEKKEEQQSPRL